MTKKHKQVTCYGTVSGYFLESTNQLSSNVPSGEFDDAVSWVEDRSSNLRWPRLQQCE